MYGAVYTGRECTGWGSIPNSEQSEFQTRSNVLAEKLHWFQIYKQKKNFEDMSELTEVSEQLSEQTRKKCEESIYIKHNVPLSVCPL